MKQNENESVLQRLEDFFSDDLRHSIEEISNIIWLAFNHSFDGFCVTRGDGTMVVVNRAAAGYLHLSPKDLLNRDVKDMVAENLYDHSTALDVFRERKKITRIYRTRSNKSILNTSTPIFDKNGMIKYVVQNERDITKIKLLEKRLKKEHALKNRLLNEVRQLSSGTTAREGIIAHSRAMKNVLNLTSRCANLDLDSLLIQGETGVGKGILTDFFHRIGNRCEKSLIRVNCAALPENLLEAELFGYERGAFTGAGNKAKPGLFELAEGGILFLDEVGELPMPIQAKLLNCLEELRIRRLGGVDIRKINCCIVAATNRNLQQMCANKTFRKDLFYRLNTVNIKVPPLRDRKEDIVPLTKYFLNLYNEKYKMHKSISPRAYFGLNRYDFPGNVRELSNIINNAMIMTEGNDVIDGGALLDHIQPPPNKAPVDEVVSVQNNNFLASQVQALEKQVIKNTLQRYATVLEAAQNLGISKATMMRKLKRYRLLKKHRAR